MSLLLPWILAVIAIALVAAMPWRRSDPHHEFVFEICRRLAKGAPIFLDSDSHAPGTDEVESSDHWIGSTDLHRSGRSRV